MTVLGACNSSTLHKTNQSNFPKNRWYQSNPIELEFIVEEVNQEDLYDFVFNFSYVYGSQFAEIPIEVYITNPLHQIEKIPYVIRLRDEEHKELGDCAGDYCDMKLLLKENYKFTEKGSYKIQVLNTFNHEYLPNVLSVTIGVDKKK